MLANRINMRLTSNWSSKTSNVPRESYLEVLAEPAKRANSIKPGVERSGTPGSFR